MEKYDYYIIALTIIIIFILFLTLFQISNFMKKLETCNDDFEIINKCGCIPCSWKDSEKMNNLPCMNLSF